jgi:hypothetical protein
MQRRQVLTTAFVVVGAALLVTSWLTAHVAGREWVSDVLVNGGTAVLLFAPFYWLTRGLDRHIEEVRQETATSVEGLTERVTRFESDVDRRLEEVAASVSQRLADERAADSASIERLRTAPSRPAVVEALSRATELGLVVAAHPPRVAVSDRQRLYLSVKYETEDEGWHRADDELVFALENIAGTPQEWIPWSVDESVDDVFVRIGRALQKMTGEDLDVARYFDDLADLLSVAQAHPARRPIVQICPPQWAITTRGVERYDAPHEYGFTHEKLASDTGLTRHIAEKQWGDVDSFEEAYMVALDLFPKEEPPF